MALGPVAFASIALLHGFIPALAGQLVPVGRWTYLESQSQPMIAAVTGAFAVVLTFSAWMSGAMFGVSNVTRARSISIGTIWLLSGCAYFGLLFFAAERIPKVVPFLLTTAPLFLSLALAGWLTCLWLAATGTVNDGQVRSIVKCLFAVSLYSAIYSVMGYWQYQALHVPHGDTGMYEEHLWNILHGKGFRSQLDGGRLFLGERFQFSHVLLLPLYYFRSDLITLQTTQTIALAVGAIAVWQLARNMELSPFCASSMAIAYLLYFPLQYLNLEITWKSFRPNFIGVPLVLFALAALEARRYGRMLILLLCSLSAAEDYAFVTGAIGLYLALTAPRQLDFKRRMTFGTILAIASACYLGAVLTVGIPYFRGGVPHFTSYFQGMGSSPREVVDFIFHNPQVIAQRLATVDNLKFVLMMLIPLGLLPLASPLRAFMSTPVFFFLMLAEREMMNTPGLHFHGPLIPILIWAAVGGVRNLSNQISCHAMARWAACCALVTGVWLGESPLSWKFYDPIAGVVRKKLGPRIVFEPRGSYWRDRFVPDERVQHFAEVEKLVKQTDRVAATDWILTRFTHCERAFDYPLRSHVYPDDIDWIILDKTEGWWGRGETNPDQAMLRLMDDVSGALGKRFDLTRSRGEAKITCGFEVLHNDPYFFVARRIEDAKQQSINR